MTLDSCSSSARSLAVSSTDPPSPPARSLEEKGEVAAIFTSTGRGGGRLLLLLLAALPDGVVDGGPLVGLGDCVLDAAAAAGAEAGGGR